MFTVNPCKSVNETFGPLNSNCENNPYIEPGKYHLRAENSSDRSFSTVVHKSPFKNMQGHQKVKKSEFDYFTSGEIKGAYTLRNFVNRSEALYAKKTSEPFSQFKEIGYSVDPFELK